MRLVFDIEGNGLLDKITRIHCIGMIDLDTGEQFSFGPDRLQEALVMLYEADELIGHYVIGFDLKALRKVLQWNPRPGTRITDTVVVARMLHGDVKKEDLALRADMPNDLKGKHSLRAWGWRLGFHKGDYPSEETRAKMGPDWDCWAEWSEEMQSYMDQDVAVNAQLINRLKPWEYPQPPLELEHRAEMICTEMRDNGWYFDEVAARNLYIKLVGRRQELENSLRVRYQPWQKLDRVLIPKRDNVSKGYRAGIPVEKYKTVHFNPGSRQHIELKLREAGWKPTEMTPSGAAKLDEAILEELDIELYPAAKELIEYLMVQRRLGQLGDGDNAWLKKVSNGKVHCTTNPCGTVTTRATHYDFNTSQVPAVTKPYGTECRALFGVPRGWKLVGADQAGLELRTFAHYLTYFDGGTYAKVVVDGDPHWYHTTALDLVPPGTVYDKDNKEHKDARNKLAKRWIYAWLYGAGPPKLASILNRSVVSAKASSSKFLERIPAIAKLRQRCVAAAQRGRIRCLDGRYIPIRSEHAALNSLLQSAGAIVCKQWLVDAYDALLGAGYTCGYDGDFVFCGYIHDELQIACRAEIAEHVGSLVVAAARAAGRPYDLKVPLDSDYVIGNNWAETH